MARSTAWSAISQALRPEARLWSASPIPVIATWRDTSSSGVADPQSGRESDTGRV
jgi:hypothetical protein